MRERWRPVPRFERYEVSDHGRVRSVGTRNRPKMMKARVVKGYARVSIHCGNCHGKANLYVHLAVLAAFRGPCPLGEEARHLDGRSTNNVLRNLRWGTKAENEADKKRHGAYARGGRNAKAKLTEPQVVSIIRALLAGARPGELAERYAVSVALIGQIKRRIIWKHVWERMEKEGVAS